MSRWVLGQTDPGANAFDPENSVALSGVAVRDGRLVAVGTRGYCCRFRSYASLTGVAWDVINSALRDEPGVASRMILTTPSGWILIGTRGGESDMSWAVWTSPDAKDWRLVPSVVLSGSDTSWADALVRDDGALLIVGSQRSSPSAWVIR